MDVHHHPSAEKRTWKSYLFEFFMLFLAVFLGVLAEWQLEHAIERQREKQFIQSLAEDLKRDTLEANAYIRYHQVVLGYCDSLQASIRRPDLFTRSNDFYTYSRQLAGYARYNATDRTMLQLKNAGNLRLIRNWAVSNKITDYDNQTKMLSESDQQLNDQINKYRGYLVEFLDLSSYDRLNQVGSFMDGSVRTRGNPGFIRIDTDKARIIYNQAFAIRAFLSLVIQSATGVKQEATGLLTLIQKEYDIR